MIHPNSQWAYAKEGSYKMALRKMKNQPDVYRGIAKDLKKWVLENFSEQKIYEQFVDCLSQEDPEEQVIVL